MKITKNDLGKSQVELTVEMLFSELEKFLPTAIERLSKNLKIGGFRPGKAPAEMVKQLLGEMAILEEAAQLAINKNLDKVLAEQVSEQIISRPEVSITKLAPSNDLEFKVVVTILPSIEINNYQGLDLVREKIEIKDDDVAKVIDQLREAQLKEVLVDRGAIDGDKLVADIKMFLDKVPLDNGQSQGTAIILGKDYLVPGFDAKILGLKAGENREFEITYPSDWRQANLAGKKVEFIVTVKEVFERQLPEVNDEFVKNFGLKNVEELKHNIKHSLEHEREHEVQDKLDNEIIKQLIDRAKFGDLPEVMVASELDAMIHELAHNVESYGGKFEDYLTSLKKTREQLALEMTPQALDRVKGALLIRQIFQLEKITVSPEEIDREHEKLLAQYKDNPKVIARINEADYKDRIASQIGSRKVVLKLRELNEKK